MRGILIRYGQRTTCGSCEKKTLKQAFFFQMQEKWQIVTFQTPIVCNCMKKKYVVTNYDSVFIGVGHHYFLYLHTILRMPTVILTAYVVRACLSILLRLTVVVCLHYLSCVKRILIDKHALMVESRKICFFLLSHYHCSNEGSSHVEYYHWPRDFPFR